MRPVDRRLSASLLEHLRYRHKGEARAASWETLRSELGFGGAVRRLQECADLLLEQGEPVVGLSEAGVFLAETIYEVERAYRQRRGAAFARFQKCRPLKRILAVMRGQADLLRRQA